MDEPTVHPNIASSPSPPPRSDSSDESSTSGKIVGMLTFTLVMGLLFVLYCFFTVANADDKYIPQLVIRLIYLVILEAILAITAFTITQDIYMLYNLRRQPFISNIEPVTQPAENDSIGSNSELESNFGPDTTICMDQDQDDYCMGDTLSLPPYTETPPEQEQAV